MMHRLCVLFISIPAADLIFFLPFKMLNLLFSFLLSFLLFLMKTKNGHILTFSDKMQISAILCRATCDWFCPMTSHVISPNSANNIDTGEA